MVYGEVIGRHALSMNVVVVPPRIDQELPLKYKAQHVAARVGLRDQPEWYTWNCDRPTWAQKSKL